MIRPTQIIKETQTEQVALQLEKQIVSNAYPLGCKIPSIRKLAREFSVGEQVIKLALDILEEKDMIIRKPRSGIYLNSKFFQPQQEFFLFTSCGKTSIVDYASLVLSTSNYELWHDINLNTRSLLHTRLSKEIIRYELGKIRDACPDCLITVHYNDEIADLYNNLPFPVIVIGGVKREDARLAPPNQIMEDTGERAEFMVQVAASRGYHEIVMLGAPGGWEKELRDRGQRMAEKLGIGFRYVAHTGGMHAATVKAVLEGKRPDCILLDGFTNIDLFAQHFAEEGLHFGKDVKIIADGEIYPGGIKIEYDYQEFSREAVGLIRKLLENPSLSMGSVVLSGLIKRRVFSIEPQALV